MSTGNHDGSDEETLLRALGAPGRPDELADEERYRAMFREARASDQAEVNTVDGVEGVIRLRSRTPRRVVVAAGVAAGLAVATGGVAAAYTGNLPDPIQRIAHQVIGAPPTSPRPTPVQTAPSRGPSGSRAPTPAGSSPTLRPTHRPTHHPSHHPTRPPSGTPSSTASASASATAGATPEVTASTTPATPSPSASGSPTPSPRPVVGAVSIAGGGHTADVGARLEFTGQVTSSSDVVVAKQKVVLQQRFGPHWVFVAAARTDATGTVSLDALPLQRSSSFRLRAGAVTSAAWRVAMHPLLTVTTTNLKQRTTIDVSTAGARPGDLVTLVTKGSTGSPTTVDRARLAADGTVTFTVVPQATRTRYAVVLTPSRRHTAARVAVTVPKAKT